MVASTTRIRIGLLFGGRSAEHDVSVLSATNVARALDPGRYDIVPIFVTRDGLWLQSRLTDRGLDRPAGGPRLCLVPGGRGRMVALPSEGMVHELPRFDALFPVLHGLRGEDDAPQGAAAVAGVPLVGCDLLGSAVALDKAVAKRLPRRGRRGAGQRGQHHPGLHRYQHVSQADGRQRHRLSRPHRPAGPARPRPRRTMNCRWSALDFGERAPASNRQQFRRLGSLKRVRESRRRSSVRSRR